MIDIKFLRENPDAVKENIKKKFQDHKLPLVDEVIELDAQARKTQQEADNLRAERNKLSKQIGALMGQGKKDEAEEVKKQVGAQAQKLEELAEKEKELSEKVTKIMMTIPNIIDPSVPIGKNDEENVEVHSGQQISSFSAPVKNLELEAPQVVRYNHGCKPIRRPESMQEQKRRLDTVTQINKH